MPEIRASMRQLDPVLAIRINPLEENLDFWRTVSRLSAGLSSSLSLLALVLSSVGVYGVVSYVVSRRLREVGIRMAIGATPGAVRRLVFSQGLALIGEGIAIGVGLAFASTRVLASLLHDVSPTDPATFAAAAALLTSAGLTACWLPARRASAVDPRETLQSE